MGLEDGRVRLGADAKARVQNIIGNAGGKDDDAPLDSEEQARFNALFGDSKPGDAASKLSQEEGVRFRNIFGDIFENPPSFGLPLNAADIVPDSIKNELTEIAKALLETPTPISQNRG